MCELRKKFELFDHMADIGIRGYGKTVEEAFENGAKAIFSLMFNLDNVRQKTIVNIQVESKDIETLFVEWLNELLAQSDIHELVFSEFQIDHIQRNNDLFLLKGVAKGETLDIQRHEPKIEVKAATYEELKIVHSDECFFAQTVVDV